MLKDGHFSAAAVGVLFQELRELNARLAALQLRLDEASRGSAEFEKKLAAEMQGAPEWAGPRLARADLEMRFFQQRKEWRKMAIQISDTDDAFYARAASRCKDDVEDMQHRHKESLAEARRNYEEWCASERRKNVAKLEQRARELAAWKTKQLEKEVRAWRQERGKKRKRERSSDVSSGPWWYRKMLEDPALVAPKKRKKCKKKKNKKGPARSPNPKRARVRARLGPARSPNPKRARVRASVMRRARAAIAMVAAHRGGASLHGV